MRIRKKFLLGNIFAISSFIVVVWLFKESGPTMEGNKQAWRQQSQSGVFARFLQKPGFFITEMSKCISSLGMFKVTANFTLNNVLDRMKISLQKYGIQAAYLSDSGIAEPAVVSVQKGSHTALDEQTLEIIVIPHSHNDPGWKKTYMKYFQDQTTHILSNIVEKLTEYPDMTFIWVESCFLHTWWSNQTVATREKFRELVHSGRLEIVSGMWVAPDEASPHYFALVDQMIEGHYWVKKNLNIVPESSLNFDQFGYSSSMPYFVKKAGLKNVLIKRIHRGVKQIFGYKHWMNFNWRQFWDPYGENDIFALVDTYEWMSISDSCGPDRVTCRGLDFSENPDLPQPGTDKANVPFKFDRYTGAMAANLDDFVEKLVRQFRLKSANYNHKVMMLPHGGDFHYAEKSKWDRQYRNMKLFMDYVNQRKSRFNINMRFGTLKDYFNEVEKQTTKFDLKFPVVSGDFFTYTEGVDYWTGYFTTRPFDKRLSREVLESLRAAEMFAAILMKDPNSKTLPEEFKKELTKKLVTARQNLGIFQHHDAITGTSQAHVAADYEMMLSSAFTMTQEVLSSAVQFLSQNDVSDMKDKSLLPFLQRMDYKTLTKRVPIKVSSTGTKLVLVNSLTQPRTDIVSVTSDTEHVVLTNHEGKVVAFDAVPSVDGSYELLFEVSFPPVSVLTYTMKTSTADVKVDKLTEPDQVIPKDIVCDNQFMNVTFSRETGSPLQVCYKKQNFCADVKFEWRHYRGSGGAYTMRSNGLDDAINVNKPKVSVQEGNKVCRVKATFDKFQTEITLPTTSGVTGRALRVNIQTDLSSTRNFNGDLALRIISDVNNSDTFFVDSNSFQMLGRKFRKSLPFDANVYPMSSVALIEDNDKRLLIHSAQPHGVVSRTSGVLDIMLDRDGAISEMDMPEPVHDNKPTRSIFFIELQSSEEFDILPTKETTLLSLDSVYLNDILQHPIYKFYGLSSLHGTTAVQSFLKQDVSCDTIVVNIKNLADEQYVSDGTSLTVSRRAVSCGKQTQSQFCKTQEQSYISPGQFLGRSEYQLSGHVTEVTLSHLIDKRTVFKDDKLALYPMDIRTFHLN